MRTSYLYPIVLLLVVVILGTVYVSSKNDETPQTPNAEMSSTTSEGTPTTPVGVSNESSASPSKPGSIPPTATSYTSAQVAVHSSQESCWTSINGSVYDVTSWIGKHPGGDGAILSLCGKDGSSMFNGQHGGQEDPMEALATYRIGALAQ